MAIIIPKFFWSLDLTGRNSIVLWKASAEYTVTVAAGPYQDANALAAAIQAAAATNFAGMTVTVDATTGRFIFTWSAYFEFRGGAAAGILMSPVLGFLNLTSLPVGSGPYVVTSPYQHTNGWYPQLPPETDSLDMRQRPNHVATRAMNGETKVIVEPEVKARMWVFSWLAPEYTYAQYELTASVRNTAAENFFANGFARFRYFGDRTVNGVYGDYTMQTDTMQTFAPKRMYQRKALYSWTINAWGYV